MRRFKFIVSILTAILLTFSLFSMSTFAEGLKSNASDRNKEVKAVVLAKTAKDTVRLLQDDSNDSKVLTSIPDNTEVAVLNKGKDRTYVSYTVQKVQKSFKGYVKNRNLFDPSMVKQALEKRKASQSTDAKSIGTEYGSKSSDSPKSDHNGYNNSDQGVTKQGQSNQNEAAKENNQNNQSGKDKKESDQNRDKMNKPDSNQSDRTDQSNKQEQKKTSHENKQAKPRAKTFAKKTKASGPALQGVALKNNTAVYTKMDKNSNILKSYSQGSILKFKDLNSDWYQATVYINGEKKSGYINKNDVEIPTSSPKTLHGVAVKNPTRVYTKASTGSKTLKSYAQGSMLKYNTFTSNWYKATVYIKGKKKTAYINKNDVEIPTSSPKTLHGVAVKSPTKVYSKASTGSKALKSYAQGSTLKYKTYTTNWYKATVYIKGKKKTGYINKNDVEIPTSSPKTLHGVGLKSPTRVYSKASTGSKVLKSYPQGSVLKYKTFISGWYEATVIIKGDKKTGYIKKSDVKSPTSSPKTLHGVASESRTKVYTNATTHSKVLKSYAEGSILKYKTFISGWYEATVYIHGKAKTGYIKSSSVQNIDPSPKTYKRVLSETTKTNVYTKPTVHSKILKTYRKGATLKYKTFTTDWYQCTVYIKGKPVTGYIKVHRLPLSGRVIVLDPGHGGNDPGASGIDGTQEQKLNYDYGQAAKKTLKDKGAKVVFTHGRNKNCKPGATGEPELQCRADVAKENHADIYISIHGNWWYDSDTHGVETYYNAKGNSDYPHVNPYPTKSRLLAQDIQKKIVPALEGKDNGTINKHFYVNRMNTVPSVLIELGYISNREELNRLEKKSTQSRFSNALVSAIAQYFKDI